MIRVVAILVVLATCLPSPTAAAGSPQELLPPPGVFMDGWAPQTIKPADDLPASAFAEGALGVYGGTYGARVTLLVAQVKPGDAATREAWEWGTRAVDIARGSIDPGRGVGADGPPLAGCGSVRRVVGQERIGGAAFPVGVTLCAADPRVIVVAIVSGRFYGVTGTKASDLAVGLVLDGLSDGGTPAGTPVP